MQETGNAAPPLNLRWTLSNALSALRIVLVLPAALTLANDMRLLTAGICLLATLTDVLDGYLARRWNEISDLGKILDPLADKVFVGALVVLLLAKGSLPLWLVLVVLGRDLLILVGGLWVERRTHTVLPSNYPGKIAVLILSGTLFTIILNGPAAMVNVMIVASLALLGVSFGLYAARAARVLRGTAGA